MVSPTRLAPTASRRGSSGDKVWEEKQDEKSEAHKRGDVDSAENRSVDGKRSSANSPLQLLSSPVATPSRPMVIPTRSQSGGKGRRDGRKPGAMGSNAESDSHSASATSPSMAALLALTSLPKPAGRGARRIGPRSPIRVGNGKGLEATEAEDSRPLLSSGSPRSWKMLQSPPEDFESDLWSLASDSITTPAASHRSCSIDSVPALDVDLESPRTTSYPATPASRPSRPHRPGRLNSLSSAEACADHPLSPRSVQSPSPASPDPHLAISPTRSPALQTSARPSFTSNLTASLRALRNATMSRSPASPLALDRTSPQRPTHAAALPTDTPSLLSMKLPYATEKRPAPSNTIPDPALRRYLNPLSISPADLYIHTQATRSPDRITASIQLQSYSRVQVSSTSLATGTVTSIGATSPPVFMPSARHEVERRIRDEAERAEVGGVLRQREARENGDFLRVVVLEMSMRRNGKLRDEQTGRARLWLPPRVEIKKETEAPCTPGAIPTRWRGCYVEEEACIRV